MKLLFIPGIILASALYASEWYDVINLPGDLEPNTPLSVVSGELQPLNFALKTTAENLKKPDHKVKFEWTLPDGSEWIAGMVLREEHSLVKSGENIYTDSFNFPGGFVQAKNEKSEWKTYKCAVKFAPQLPENSELKLKVYVDGEPVCEKSWSLDATPKPAPLDGSFKKLRFGLWDYGYSLLKATHPEILLFWQKIGFNYSQSQFSDAPAGFISGGNIHQSAFINPNYPNYNVSGRNLGVSLALGDADAVYRLGLEKVLPKVAEQMATVARNTSQVIAIDYEPTGLDSFSPTTIAEFCREYQISETDFNTFRDAYAKMQYAAINKMTGKNADIFRKWVDFSSSRSVFMVKAFREALKKNVPSAKLEITTHDSAGKNDPGTLLIGNDNSAMAAELDAIMPQIYKGYGHAAAKNIALRVRHWRNRVSELNPECKLYPLLLVRHMGASISNLPQMVKLQMVGAIAEGADGVILYYAQQLNGNYYHVLNETMQQLRRYEDFYTEGTRSDSKWVPAGMPRGSAQTVNWPESHIVEITDPLWHYTAHEWNGKTLLTLFNYGTETLTFRFGESMSFLVAPSEVRFEVVNEQRP